MEKLDKITDVKVGEQQTEVDPRSKTTADKAYNLIGTGGPEDGSKRSRCSVSKRRKEDLKRTNYVVQCS